MQNSFKNGFLKVLKVNMTYVNIYDSANVLILSGRLDHLKLSLKGDLKAQKMLTADLRSKALPMPAEKKA